MEEITDNIVPEDKGLDSENIPVSEKEPRQSGFKTISQRCIVFLYFYCCAVFSFLQFQYILPRHYRLHGEQAGQNAERIRHF